MFGAYRFVLSLLVALSHDGVQFHGFNPGQWSVVCFYVLSGLLMERQYNKLAVQGGSLSFYVDRLLRVFPLYLSVVLLCVLTTRVPWRDLAANLALLPLNYATFSHVAVYVGPAWSLACEFQFYLLVPVLVVLPTRALRCLIAASLTLFALSPFLPNTAFWAYVGLPGILFTFLSGILINRKDWAALRVCYAMVAFLCAAFLFSKLASLGLPSGINCNVCIGYLAAIPATAYLARLSPKVYLDRALGLFSYPLFLIHTLVLELCFTYFPTAVTVWKFIGLSLLASCCLIILVEVPSDFVRYKVRAAKVPRAKGSGPG